jgi:hypothetical protein
LEYIYFMKIGQPKLSERKSQRSGLVVIPTTVQSMTARKINDYAVKYL